MISVITPSFNMINYIKRCHASVIDQGAVLSEHIIVDGLSNDGTIEWLNQENHDLKLKRIIEKDTGMYNAINKGFKEAKGDILGHLNADEQYLEGTLEFVKKYFDEHPETDFIAGDMILIREDGSPISYRKGLKPRLSYILSSYLYLPTCTIFYRKSIMDRGFYFDESYRNIGDIQFIVRLLTNGFKGEYVRKYLSVFAITGVNLSTKPFDSEKEMMAKYKPWWIQVFKFPLNIIRLCEKLLTGAYFQKLPLRYSVYGTNSDKRTLFSLQKRNFRFKF